MKIDVVHEMELILSIHVVPVNIIFFWRWTISGCIVSHSYVGSFKKKIGGGGKESTFTTVKGY